MALLNCRRSCWSFWVGIGLLLLPALAHGDDDSSRVTYADRLFQDGVELMKKDRCPEAIPKLLSSERLDPGAGTLINLATCYVRVERPAAAWRTYLEAAALSETEKNDSLKGRALQALSQLTPKVTKVRIVVPRGMATLSLTLNGEPFRIEDGLAIALDPGENIVEAAAPGRQPWRRSVRTTEPGSTIVIEIPELAVIDRPAEPPQRPIIDRPPPGGSKLRNAAVIVGAAGVSSLVASAILALNAKATYDQSKDQCLNGRCTQQGHDLREDAIDKARLSTYAFGLGTAVALSGVVLWVVSSRQENRSIGVSPCLPAVRSALGVSLRGAF